jgi:hypothetical protein
MRNDRASYWRRREKNYWRNKHDAHDSYGKLTRQIRRSENEGRRHAVEARRLTGEIEARERAERRAALVMQMGKDRRRLLEQIAICRSNYRGDWHRRLDQIEPTASTAEASLPELRGEIERERRSLTEAPRRLRLQPVVPEPPPFPWPTPRPSPAFRPRFPGLDFVLARDQAEGDRDKERALRESTLGMIISCVDALASQARAPRRHPRSAGRV